MTYQLQQQFNEAYTKYQGSLQQLSPGKFVITIGDRKRTQYTITTPPDYPLKPPKVESPSGPVSLFPLENWSPNFTLCDIIEQLTVLGGIPSAEKFTLNRDELIHAIKSAPYSNVQNPESRLQIIKNLPSIQQAVSSVNQAEAERKKLERRIETDTGNIIQQVEILNSLSEKRQQLYIKFNQSQNPERMQIESVKNKIASLEAENVDHQNKIKSLGKQLASHAIPAEKYSVELFQVKQALLKNTSLISYLKQMIPSV